MSLSTKLLPNPSARVFKLLSNLEIKSMTHNADSNNFDATADIFIYNKQLVLRFNLRKEVGKKKPKKKPAIQIFGGANKPTFSNLWRRRSNWNVDVEVRRKMWKSVNKCEFLEMVFVLTLLD